MVAKLISEDEDQMVFSLAPVIQDLQRLAPEQIDQMMTVGWDSRVVCPRKAIKA